LGATADQAKGRSKEAVGKLTGNEDLEAEGKEDRRISEVEERVDHVIDQLGEATDRAVEASRRK